MIVLRLNTNDNLSLQTHPTVCTRKWKQWSAWHQGWAANHVSEAQQSKHNDWMLGRVEGLRANKTHSLTPSS